MMLSRLRPRLLQLTNAAPSLTARTLAMKAADPYEPPLPPTFSMDAIAPPPISGNAPPTVPDVDPMALVRSPVNSAYSVDVNNSSLNVMDSAAFTAKGVSHATFGDLDEKKTETIPLEYLPFLRHAAEASAALRELNIQNGSGTLLVYGASRPAGMSAVQLAKDSNVTVVAVVDGEHSGSDELVDAVKGMVNEPGFAVSEEYAIVKANFRNEVLSAVGGTNGATDGGADSRAYLEEFYKNLMDYTQAYPSDLPAAVDSSQLIFDGKEKDRANFKINMEAYLSQYMPGSPSIDEALLKERFDVSQYEVFKKKFGKQTTAVISGGDGVTDINRFNPPEIVNDMITSPDKEVPGSNSDDDYPFEFSILNAPSPTVPTVKGGPIGGLIIEPTRELVNAVSAVSKAKTLREKAEALQFLTDGERNAHAAVSALVKLAKDAKAPIRIVNGSLEGYTSVSVQSEDVTKALDAMALGEDGEEAKLNYFVQVYRANDFEAYEAYGIFRAGEVCTLRNVVVTK